MVNEADDAGAKLLAQGAEIELVDGSRHRLRCGFEALLTIEQRFGTLGAFHGRLSSRGFQDAKLETILYGLEAALAHKKRDGGARQFPSEQLAAQLDPKRLIDYLDALMVAFWEAMPTFEEADPKDGAGATNGSHGGGTTTSPRSSSAVRKRRSGA